MTKSKARAKKKPAVPTKSTSQRLIESEARSRRQGEILRILVPGVRKRGRQTDPAWKTIVDIADHLAWLDSLSSPLKSRSLEGSGRRTNNELAISPGVVVTERGVRWSGQDADAETSRFLDQLAADIRDSKNRMGDVEIVEPPRSTRIVKPERPRCVGCRGIVNAGWRHCAHCGQRLVAEKRPVGVP